MRVYLLHGGVQSWDGIVSGAGMNILVSKLRQLSDVTVQTYLWHNWMRCYRDIMMLRHGELRNEKIVLIGYSGGGAHITWVANGYNGGPVNLDSSYEMKPPHIDLLVAYDPSPKNATFKLENNVKRAICYHNLTPMMFGLGGGRLEGPQVETVEIAMQHLRVQFSSELHNRTVDEVRQCQMA